MTPAEPLYVQFGCGLAAPPTWLNFDASPTLRVERLPLVGRWVSRNPTRFPPTVRYGDVVAGLPVPDGSCAGLYASHVLEHLALADCRTALANCHRHLRPGGIFRLIVPDMEVLARAYLEQLASEPAAAVHTLMRNSHLGDEARPRRLRGRLADVVGNSRHRWMWDYPALSHELSAAGFTRVRRCAFHDCEDPMFRNVEDAARFDDSVAIECRR